MSELPYAVGLMSGTSLDGVDAALVEVNGVNEETTVNLMEFLTVPLKAELVEKIQASFSLSESNSALMSSLNMELGYVFADAVKKVCERAKFLLKNVDFIASHGQTIYHIPNNTKEFVSSTLQIGESSVITEETKTTVISDFRTRDMAVGGQGAPIVPYSEYVLYRDENRLRLLQNIGGIGNVTIIPSKAKLDDMIAFDTGPGNMVINELCHRFYNISYDDKGKHAAEGQVNDEVLSYLMSHPFVEKQPPKTTGREEFGVNFVHKLIDKWKLKPNDWLATATMFTAKTIAQSVRPFVTQETDLIVGGGGSYNQTLMQMIQKSLPEVNVIKQEELGYSSEAKEAIAMVVLGNQTIHHQPSNVPSATGAKKAVMLGKVTYYD